jgi:hypothetical protein
MKLAALLTVLAVSTNLIACSAADDSSSREGTSADETEQALSRAAKKFVGDYKWNDGADYLDYASLTLKGSTSTWGTYVGQVDTSVTGFDIFCKKSPCTTEESGKWRVVRSQGDLHLLLRPAGATQNRTYVAELLDDGSLKLSRGGQSGVLAPLAACVRTGCSGQLCSDRHRVTTCDMRPEYTCYRAAICERDDSGQCGFRQTQDLTDCIASHTAETGLP